MISIARISFLTILLLLLNLEAIHAVDSNDSTDKREQHRFNISLVPQYVAVNALRVDFGYAIKPSQSLLFSPRLYTAQDMDPLGNSDFNNFNYDLTGFGAELSHIFFLDDENAIDRFYHGYNLHYTFYKLNYEVESFVDDVENGLPVLVPGIADESIEIQQLGFGYLIGLQHHLSKQVFLDFYVGLGVKYAQLKDSNSTNRVESEQRANEFQSGFINYAYQGTHINSGIKIGVKF